MFSLSQVRSSWPLAKFCILSTATIAVLVISCDYLFNGRDYFPFVLLAFFLPLVAYEVIRIFRFGGWRQRRRLLVVLAFLAMIYWVASAPGSLARGDMAVGYRSEVTIMNGWQSVREEVTIDQKALDEYSKYVNEASNKPPIRLDVKDAQLPSEWKNAGSLNGNPVFVKLTRTRVGKSRMMKLYRVSIGDGVLYEDVGKGLGTLVFSGVGSWTMVPGEKSTVRVRVPHGSIEATYPNYANVADAQDGSDVATIPVGYEGQVVVSVFGSLLNNKAGRQAYKIYQEGLPGWIACIIVGLLGTMLLDWIKGVPGRLASRRAARRHSGEKAALRGSGRGLVVPEWRRHTRVRPIDNDVIDRLK